MNVTGSEDALDARLGSTGDSDNVTIGIGLKLASHESGGGFVTDGVEETIDLEFLLFAREGVANEETIEEVTVSTALDGDGVPEDGDLGVVGQPFLHDFRRTQFTPTNENVDVGTILGKIYKGDRQREKNWVRGCRLS